MDDQPYLPPEQLADDVAPTAGDYGDTPFVVQMIVGAALTLGGHASMGMLAAAVGAITDGIGAIAVLFIGVVQLVYVVPLAMWRRHRKGEVSGIVLVAALTALLNAGCWSIMRFPH